MRIRTGYSFRTAVGHLDHVVERLQAIGWNSAPISDRYSTFGFTRWTKICEKVGLKPIYGVEIGCVVKLGEKKPTIDYWVFFAIDRLEPLHRLIETAGNNPGREPVLLYSQALAADGVVKIAGERLLVEALEGAGNTENLFVGLSPSTPKGLVRRVNALGLNWLAVSDNSYPCEGDREFFRVTLGNRANTQIHPQHILSDEEWKKAVSRVANEAMIADALSNRDAMIECCDARQSTAELLHPERPATLRTLCEHGAELKGCDLSDAVYAERLDRELGLIAEKDYEDYFFILADMVQWAKGHMVVGPARGSSCGSLVCYLLDITSIDPIPHGLIFERFIDVNRQDLPDIDVDFSDANRKKVFEYAEEKYGRERVARLGTVGMFKPRSAVNQAGAALRIPRWRTNKLMDYIIERLSGDSRAMNAMEDTFNETEAGQALLQEHPEILIATEMEGHPNVASQHAAGVLITDKPIREYVAVDPRTGAAMCDKKDSEDLNLLKIDALGLTQLSIFERCLELIGEKPVSGWLEQIPLNDSEAFKVLNEKRFSGIFQFNGIAMRSLASQIHYDQLSDIVATTALARPGPLATGGASSWVARKAGTQKSEAIHPMLTALTEETYGVVVYQEQVMRVVREMGNMSWEDTSAIRKAMSGRLGDEFFAQYKIKFLAGAERNGVPHDTAEAIWKQINTFGCLSGDTVLTLPGANQYSPRQITLKELFETGGYARKAEESSNRDQQLKRPKAQLWCLTSKVVHGSPAILPRRLDAVVQSGVKRTFLLVTESGKSIRATADHKFLLANGKWRRLGRLRPGDKIQTFGPKHKDKKWKGSGSGAHNRWHGQSKKFVAAVKHLQKTIDTCQVCKIAPYEETHHIDEDRMNNDLSNLLPVCRKCHKTFHEKPQRHTRGRIAEVERIESISDPKFEMTYDISMEPENNFVANEIITHNSWAFNKCIHENTEIWVSRTGTSLKKRMKISDLHEKYTSDPAWNSIFVWSMDESGKFVEQRVSAIHKNGQRVCWEYGFSDGSTVQCTQDHKFLINFEWAPIGAAKIGDWFKQGIVNPINCEVEGRDCTLVSKRFVGMQETYDLEMPTHHNFLLANGLLTHNSHAVAYGIVSYWCCWLKAHHPMEFAAATLDAEKDPDKQIALLRELDAEGITYVPFDPDKSTDRWMSDGNRLIGPLTAIKGFGPAKVREILDCRTTGEEIRPALRKALENSKTPIDSLYPIQTRINELHPDLKKINIFSEPMAIEDVQPGVRGDVMILARVNKIAPFDENQAVSVAKRGGRRLSGPVDAINLFFSDDSGEIFGKVSRFDYSRLADKILKQGRAGKSLFAIKGTVPTDFRMIKIKAIRYLGDME